MMSELNISLYIVGKKTHIWADPPRTDFEHSKGASWSAKYLPAQAVKHIRFNCFGFMWRASYCDTSTFGLGFTFFSKL